MGNKYKTSKYNYLIDYKNKKLLFNGITGMGFCMTLQEWEKLLPLLNDLDKFKSDFNEDFERLSKLGYIMESDFNELAYIQYRNKESVFLDNAYHIIINPTLECNFHCWYCYQEHPKGKMTDETLKRIKKHLTFKIENKQITSLNLSWFGGEPMLYFHEIIYPLTKFANELCKTNKIPFISTITTNAYCIDENIVKCCNEIGLIGFQITLDGHRNRHNKIRNCDGTPSYDKIIENINLLCENIKDIDITLRVNYDKQTLKQDANNILEDIKKINREKIQVDLQQVWQTVKKPENNEIVENKDALSFIQAARNAGYKLAHCSGGLSVCKFHNCYVSRFHYLSINFDGKIYKCTARGYTEEYEMGELLEDGNIKWDIKKMSKLYANSTFENSLCINCAFLPLCMGPCPQKIMEANEQNLPNTCVMALTEQSFKDKISDIYEYSLKRISKK